MAVLNEKQRRFCHEYVTNGGNGKAAYKVAYGQSNMNEASIATQASKLARKQHIKDYMAFLRAPAIAEAQMGAATLLDELESARALAMKLGNPAAAVSAIMGKAKLLGKDKGDDPDEEKQAQPVTINVSVVDARQR